MAELQPIIIKKKKAHGGHGHHGGSWKVAYADFVTAMMAFFMVMWLMGLSDETRAQIQGYFNDPLAMNKSMPKSKAIITIRTSSPTNNGMSKVETNRKFDKEKDKFEKMIGEIKKKIGNDPALKAMLKQLEMTVTKEGLRMEFVESNNTAFFSSGSTELLPEAKRLITTIAPMLEKSDHQMVVEGHTDAHEYAGTSYTNWDLSTGRALSMYRALMAGGVPHGQFEAIRGLAATKLRQPSNPLAAVNRRVTLLLPWQFTDEKAAEAEPEEPDLGPHRLGIKPEVHKESNYNP